MSKVVKSIASVALPIIGTIVAPGIGTALGSTLSTATLSGIGGAIGGAAGGAIGGGGVKGALTGAALGGAGGYVSGGGLNGVLGTAPASLPAGAQGPVTSGTGILGSLGKAGTAINDGIGAAKNAVGITGGSGVLGGNPLLSLASTGTSAYSAIAGQDAAEKAAQEQVEATNKAISEYKTNLSPYQQSGADTVGGLTQLVNDPNAQTSFIQNNPFYNSLAEDAKNKLFANRAAKGKVGSGGTAAALQNSLLLLGNDLLNQNITQKQNLVNTGFNASNNVSNAVGGLLTDQGNAKAAGTIGGYNAMTGAINNGIGTQASLYAIDKGVRL